jgi:hypothetical protein
LGPALGWDETKRARSLRESAVCDAELRRSGSGRPRCGGLVVNSLCCPSSAPAATQQAPKHGCVRGSSKIGVSGIGRTRLAPRVNRYCWLGCHRAWGWHTQMAGWLELRIAALGLASGPGAGAPDANQSSPARSPPDRPPYSGCAVDKRPWYLSQGRLGQHDHVRAAERTTLRFKTQKIPRSRSTGGG